MPSGFVHRDPACPYASHDGRRLEEHPLGLALVAEVHVPVDRRTRCGPRELAPPLVNEACGLKARKNEKRSNRVEWEHVVRASWMGEDRTCWRKGDSLCVKKDGKAFKGRKCCLKSGVDPDFVAAHNDPHNLFPAGGEVNGDRLNHPFGIVQDEPRAYGACDFEVGGRPKVAEPADSVRGQLARAMHYMADRYGVDVRMAREELLAWHDSDPPAQRERERSRQIEALTGLVNDYIDSP